MKTIMLPQFAVIYVMNDSRLYLDKLSLPFLSLECLAFFPKGKSIIDMASEIYSSFANNTASFRNVAQCLFLVLLEKLKKVESYLKNLFNYHTFTFIGHL